MPMMRRGPGLIRTAAVVGTAGRVRRRQQQRFAQQDAQAYEQQAQAAPAPDAAPDYAAELEQLAKLRDQGVITAEDFEAKKKQLLGI